MAVLVSSIYNLRLKKNVSTYIYFRIENHFLKKNIKQIGNFSKILLKLKISQNDTHGSFSVKNRFLLYT